jgi:hypothetical protein
LDPTGSLFALESSSGVCAFCLEVSRELPEALLSRLNVIGVIRFTLVKSLASELSKSEGNETSSMDKVTPSRT